MKRGWKIVVGILALVVLLTAIYFTFFFHYTCYNNACFKEHQKECVSTIYIKDGEEVVWGYHIQGKEDENCLIDLTLIQVKKGTLDKQSLEGKSMVCQLNIKNTKNPESDISLCHGLLKEEMQKLIIDNLHKYIVSNLGQISEALNKTSI